MVLGRAERDRKRTRGGEGRAGDAAAIPLAQTQHQPLYKQTAAAGGAGTHDTLENPIQQMQWMEQTIPIPVLSCRYK